MSRLFDLLAPKGEAAPALRPEAPPRQPQRFAALRLTTPPRRTRGAPRDNVVRLTPVASVEAAPATARVGVTLRLSPEKHRDLRLYAAQQGRSMQSVLHEALERFLARETSSQSNS